MSYEAWKRSRAGAEVPPGFADRVMDSLAEPDRRAASRARRVAVIAAAVAVFAYRAACALGVFFTG